ncbi:MAG: Na+/H+ antiporter subunit E [Clostridia bacterium]|nr:Na+/H+ antiporter subunit E [Clostridia bacterium]
MVVLFFLLWIMLNGRTSADVLITGAAAAIALWLVIWKMTGYGPKKEWRSLRILPMLAAYAGLLLWEILKANLSVTKMIWSGEAPDPRLVNFSSGLRTDAANALLANSITLTPGTFTVSQKSDLFRVHCLSPRYAKGLNSSGFIKLLKRMEAVWKA